MTTDLDPFETDTDTGDDGPGLRALANLTVQVQGIGRRMDRDRQRAAEFVPIRPALQVTGTVPASGPLILDLGAPSMGRRWNLRNVSVSDAGKVRTAAAGTADVYVGNPDIYSPINCRWNVGAMPASVGFSADRVEVIPTDHLFVVVEGGTPGQVLLARAEVLDYPADRGREVIPL